MTTRSIAKVNRFVRKDYPMYLMAVVGTALAAKLVVNVWTGHLFFGGM